MENPTETAQTVVDNGVTTLMGAVLHNQKPSWTKVHSVHGSLRYPPLRLLPILEYVLCILSFIVSTLFSLPKYVNILVMMKLNMSVWRVHSHSVPYVVTNG